MKNEDRKVLYRGEVSELESLNMSENSPIT